MAGPACMSDDGRPAVFVGTMLETGDSVALCDVCLVGWVAAVLNVMTGVDPQPFLQAISEDEPIPYEVVPGAGGEPPDVQPHDTDPEAISAPEPAPPIEPPESAPKGRRRAQAAPGRTSNGLADPGMDVDRAADSPPAVG